MFRRQSLNAGYLFFILAISSNAFASNDSKKTADLCAKLMTQYHPDGLKELDSATHRMIAETEEHSLLELIDPNPETNLVQKSPWITMNAAQRALALIRSHGVMEIADPNTGAGKIKVYKFFSGGITITEGLRIVGQLRTIETLVAQIEALARGDRAGLYPVLLVGGPGTGKSETLKIFKTGLQNATLREPESFTYSYEFVGLEAIPSLRRFLSVEDHGSSKMPCPIHDSPFVLLPEPLQNALLALNKQKVESVVGFKPAPKREMCPHCAFFHHEIIRHYAKERGHNLNPSEVTEVLNNHVKIRRKVMGDPGTAPLIAVQGKDVDYAGLFVAKNPLVFADLGPGHPLSYFLNGKILGGNGNVVFVDEVGKNVPELLGKFLNTIQDRSVSEAGAPNIPIDALFIMATNTADVIKIREKDPQSPFLDRVEASPMNWAIRPENIIQTLGYEMAGLTLRKLGEAEAQPFNARTDLDAFIPMPQPGKPVVTSDGRFDVSIEEGATRVHVSPHALMYMALVAGLTRMNFSNEVIEKYGKFPIVAQPVFRDPITRIEAILGRRSDITQSMATELWTTSELAGEGTFGMTAREVSRWFIAAMKEAHKADNGGCITPALLKEVLRRQIINKKVGIDDAQRMQMLNYANLVAGKFTVDAIQADIETAVAESQEDSVKQIYDEVIEEMQAMHADPQAKSFVSQATNKPAPINRSRFSAISEIFKKRTGRPLAIDEIAMFHMHQYRIVSNETQNKATIERHRDLMAAIASWQASAIVRSHEATLKRVIRVASGRGRGSTEEMDVVKKFTQSLQHQLGYCAHCASKALEILSERPDQPHEHQESHEE